MCIFSLMHKKDINVGFRFQVLVEAYIVIECNRSCRSPTESCRNLNHRISFYDPPPDSVNHKATITKVI